MSSGCSVTMFGRFGQTLKNEVIENAKAKKLAGSNRGSAQLSQHVSRAFLVSRFLRLLLALGATFFARLLGDQFAPSIRSLRALIPISSFHSSASSSIRAEEARWHHTFHHP